MKNQLNERDELIKNLNIKIQNANEFKEMVETKGWQQLQEVITNQINNCFKKWLLMEKPDALQSEMYRVEILVCQKILSAVENVIKEGDRAREELKNLLKEGG